MDTPGAPTLDLDQPDLGWLGLERHDDDRWSFELVPGLSRLDGRFFGGTGVAVMTALMEARTSRAALWATAQFVGQAEIGERLLCDVEVLAHGRRTSQLRATARVGDRIVFVGLGSTGSERSTSLEAQLPVMPDIKGPDESRPYQFGLEGPQKGWLEWAELRFVDGLGRRTALWARMQGMRQSRATLGMLADVVPLGVVRAAGRAGAGTSLDNSIRLGPAPDSDWVLLDIDPYFASGGYVHGAARVWSEDGVLLAVASQTATMLLFD